MSKVIVNNNTQLFCLWINVCISRHSFNILFKSICILWKSFFQLFYSFIFFYRLLSFSRRNGSRCQLVNGDFCHTLFSLKDFNNFINIGMNLAYNPFNYLCHPSMWLFVLYSRLCLKDIPQRWWIASHEPSALEVANKVIKSYYILWSFSLQSLPC